MVPRKKPIKKPGKKKKASRASVQKRKRAKGQRKPSKRKGQVAPKAKRRVKASPKKRKRPIAPNAMASAFAAFAAVRSKAIPAAVVAKQPKKRKPKKRKLKPKFLIEDVPHHQFPDGTIELALEAHTVDELDAAARVIAKNYEGWMGFEAIVKKPPASVDVDEYRIGKGRYGIKYSWRKTEYRGGQEYHYMLLDFKTSVLNLSDNFEIEKLVFRFYNGKEKP